MKSNLTANYLDVACEQVAAGKQAAREIAGFLRHCDVKEPEFRLLWCLERTGSSLDQRQLAEKLVLSPAQVCAVVERLDQQGLLCRDQSSSDRRRSVWRASENGKKLLERVLESVHHTVGSELEIMPRRLSA